MLRKSCLQESELLEPVDISKQCIRDLPRMIGICGRARVGKTTTANKTSKTATADAQAVGAASVVDNPGLALVGLSHPAGQAGLQACRCLGFVGLPQQAQQLLLPGLLLGQPALRVEG